MIMRSRPILASMLAAALAGCVAAPPQPEPDTVTAADEACARQLASFDASVVAARAGDGAYARVDGFRTLRVDRLLASFAYEPMDAARFGAWVASMRALDREARAVEHVNLPADVRARFDAAALEACAERVLARDLAAPHARAWLIGSALVPDDYRDDWRALGLYPITGFGLAAGVALYEREAQAAFDVPPAPRNTRVSYRHAAPAQASPDAIAQTVAALVAAEPLPPLPRAGGQAIDALLAAYAPEYAIDTAGADDRPGRPLRRADGVPDVDWSAPVVYTRLAWTRFDGALLPQLVYTIWFARRPPSSPADPLAGALDGLVWRVTLDRDGAPLAYDTIHPCGCYHQFVPTARLRAKPREPGVEEGALVVRTLPALAIGARVRLDVASGTHYLRGVSVIGSDAREPAAGYALERDDVLRTAKLFGPDGLVAGTERLERYALWISGIASPGAMRQWGRHATAFVGRRHFDEPFLLERYFVRAPG
jgi:hypothetical protein